MSYTVIHKIVSFLLGLIVFFFSAEELSATKTHPAVKANLKELSKLDSLIERQPELSKKKEAGIQSLREALSREKDLSGRIRISNKLFEEYRFYESDSALKYSRLTYDLARQLSVPDDSLLTSSLIDQAFMYSIQGYHSKSKYILDRIAPQSLANQELRIKYFKAKEYGASMELVYAADNKENTDHIWIELLQYRDSLKVFCKNAPNRFPWIYVAEKIEGGGDLNDLPAEELVKLRLSVDTVTETAAIDAPSAYWLARYYKETGDSILMIHYLAKASQIKILNQYRENPSMPELAEYLYGFGDLDRAFNYIMHSGQQMLAYKNRNRIVMNNSIISDIKDSYNARLKQHDKTLRIYLAELIVFAILLVAFTIALINRNKKLHATQRQLSSTNSDLIDALAERDDAINSLKTANEKLETAKNNLENVNVKLETAKNNLEKANAKLETANDNLARLNKMKHEVIALAFHLAAIQIGRLDEFRKKLLRKFKANQVAQLESYLNDDEIINEYYVDLNNAFDKTVISTFPEFIEDYNNNCAENAKVDADSIIKSQTLNVRLRIYALRRLGIEKSADLAQILNVSIRTVYNNRSTDPNNSK